MKKLIYIGIIALISVAFVSCEDFSEIEQVENNAVEIVTKDSSGSGGWGLNNKWLPEWRACTREAKDCYDEIIIRADTSNNSNGSMKIFRQYLLKVLSLSDYDYPLNLYPGSYPVEIESYVDINYIKAFNDKKISLSANPNKNTNTVFFVFSDIETEKTVVVYPFALKE